MYMYMYTVYMHVHLHVFVYILTVQVLHFIHCIIELVDSISRDGPDTPIFVIHYKKRNNSEQVSF